MEKSEINSTQNIQIRVKNNTLTMFWPIIMVLIRTFLFGSLQVLFVLTIGISWSESVSWWPFYAILTNIIVFGLLSVLAKKEGMTFLNLIHFEKRRLKTDIKMIWWVLIAGLLSGAIGFLIASYFMYGTLAPPDNMFVVLPIWAAVISLLLFPLTNALVEIPTYMGYCLPRLEILWKSKWSALFISALFLAFQHFTLPISSDLKFMVWHFVSMLPLAFIVGLIYLKTRRLLAIMIIHFLLDLQLVVNVLLISLK